MGQDQVSGGVSVLCWLAAPVAMFYGNLQNLVIRSKSVVKSSSVIRSQTGVISDQLRVSLQKSHHNNTNTNFDCTAIADRLRTVSWSNDIHPTGVVKTDTRLKVVNNPLYTEWGSTADPSGEVIKVQDTNILCDKIIKNRGLKDGDSPRPWKPGNLACIGTCTSDDASQTGEVDSTWIPGLVCS